MREDYKKNFTDRLQFLGVVGPFILIMTFMCLLLRGSFKGWYLLAGTLVGLPVCWKWRWKGFWGTVLGLFSLYLVMYSSFVGSETIWQFGALVSIILGLFVTHQGYEEIKAMMFDLEIESQSRLENLIELDDQLKRSQKDWDEAEGDYREQISEKDKMITRLSLEVDTYEHSSQIIQNELKELQALNLSYLDQIEKNASQISKAKTDSISAQHEVELVQQQLALSSSERESKQSDYINELLSEIERLGAQIDDLSESLLIQSRHESSLAQQADDQGEQLVRLETLVSEKTAHICDLENRLVNQSAALKDQQEATENLNQALEEKEQQIETIQSQIRDRDERLADAAEKQKEIEHELSLARENLQIRDQQTQVLKSSKEELNNSYEYLKSSMDQKLKMKQSELEQLQNQVSQNQQRLKVLSDRQLDHEGTVKLYEERVLELEEELIEQQKTQSRYLSELNDARFALEQANMDLERLREAKSQIVEEPKVEEAKPSKHWLLQLQSILKQSSFKKIDWQHLPKDLSQEIVTLNQTKALYKQLREQFEEKNKVLEDARAKLFKAETQVEKIKKQRDQELASESELENNLQKSLFVKDEEIKTAEEEVLALNQMVTSLLQELETRA